MWSTLALALAMMFVLEGLLPLVAPASWREMFRRVSELRDGQIQSVAAASGCAIVASADASAVVPPLDGPRLGGSSWGTPGCRPDD